MEHPRHQGEYDHRHIDCQLALEPVMQQAIDDAVEVGWGRTEIIDAMASLVVNFVIASVIANAIHTDNLIAEAAAISEARKLH